MGVCVCTCMCGGVQNDLGENRLGSFKNVTRWLVVAKPQLAVVISWYITRIWYITLGILPLGIYPTPPLILLYSRLLVFSTT